MNQEAEKAVSDFVTRAGGWHMVETHRGTEYLDGYDITYLAFAPGPEGKVVDRLTVRRYYE